MKFEKATGDSGLIRPYATRCANCGTLEPTTVCRVCKQDKTAPTSFPDFREFKRTPPNCDLDSAGRPLREGT